MKLQAIVVEERPRSMFAVRLATGQQVMAHIAGVLERNYMRLVPGDRVEMELAPNDPGRGRITRKITGPRMYTDERPAPGRGKVSGAES